jgi:hypothetical protein
MGSCVRYIALARRKANFGIGVLVGSIPLFGDIFGKWGSCLVMFAIIYN